MRNFSAECTRQKLGRHGAHAGLLLVALLVLVDFLGGLLLTGPALFAQDAGEPPPADAASDYFVFLPSVAGGSALEAGTIIPGQFIVVLRDPATRGASGAVESSASTATRLTANVNGEVIYVYDTGLNGFAVRLPPEQAESAAAALEDDPGVEYVEPDRVARVLATDATQTGATWGLDRIDQVNLPLNSTYVYTSTGVGVHAYIIDTGRVGEAAPIQNCRSRSSSG